MPINFELNEEGDRRCWLYWINWT